MSKKITDLENISELESKKKSKSQEIWKVTADSIKDILTSNWEKILFTDEEIQAILENRWEWDLWDIDQDYQYNDIRIIANCLKNLDRAKMKDFIKRKKEYLENNRTISKEKFEKLFCWSGKFWKAEINQWEIWMCGTYSWLELLKKTNWFDEMIQTNLKETVNWWEVRLPFCDKNWIWIKVNKNEIDSKVPRRHWWWFSNVNSLSKFLWFKILEIALIKKHSISGNNPIRIQEDFKKEYESTWDISLSNEDILVGLENSWRDEATNIFLENFVLRQTDHFNKKKLMDLTFNYHWKGLYKIILHTNHGDKKVKNPIIINKNTDQLIWDNGTDIITDENWNKSVTFVGDHIYSIEKCYVTSEWEKRVRVVNPWHTWIKFDISLEDCKSIFDREVIGIDLDKMFR